MFNKEYWKIADETKRRLFNRIRNFSKEEPLINVSNDWDFVLKYQEEQKEKTRKLILEEWGEIKREYKGNPNFDEDKIDKQIMIIYIDIFGNEKREIKKTKRFHLEV